MNTAVANPYWQNFLGSSPDWYKKTIIAFLIINPILFNTVGPFVTGWVLIGQFIFTLALALQCYPLQPGGLLALKQSLLAWLILTPFSTSRSKLRSDSATDVYGGRHLLHEGASALYLHEDSAPR